MRSFKTWLESTFESEAQDMWNSAYDVLPYSGNNMNKALADYCLHMVEMDTPISIGRILGMALQHAQHYNKMAMPVDRNEVFKFLGDNPVAQQIKKAALMAYSTYEIPDFTKDTIQRLG